MNINLSGFFVGGDDKLILLCFSNKRKTSISRYLHIINLIVMVVFNAALSVRLSCNKGNRQKNLILTKKKPNYYILMFLKMCSLLRHLLPA